MKRKAFTCTEEWFIEVIAINNQSTVILETNTDIEEDNVSRIYELWRDNRLPIIDKTDMSNILNLTDEQIEACKEGATLHVEPFNDNNISMNEDVSWANFYIDIFDAVTRHRTHSNAIAIEDFNDEENKLAAELLDLKNKYDAVIEDMKRDYWKILKGHPQLYVKSKANYDMDNRDISSFTLSVSFVKDNTTNQITALDTICMGCDFNNISRRNSDDIEIGYRCNVYTPDTSFEKSISVEESIYKQGKPYYLTNTNNTNNTNNTEE